MQKEEIRKKILAMRRGLASNYIEDASEKIFDAVTELDAVKNAKSILMYSDFDGEVKTGKLTGWLLYHGAAVALPTIYNKQMYAVNIKGAPLEMCSFGMTQPKYTESALVPPDQIDVVIVPGVAFDRKKNRIGFGKGYYDSYLKKTTAVKIAVAYEFQVVDTIDTHEGDVPVDLIITPEFVVE